MTVTTAPLLLLSELQRNAHVGISDKLSAPEVLVAQNRLRDLIRQASEQFTLEANERRFDRYYDTRLYTARALVDDGDLFNSYELRLDADLRAVTTLTNGDDTAITASQYQLMPLNKNEKNTIHLGTDEDGTTWTYSDDPVGAISVFGTWGYGGSFPSTGTTIQDNPLTSSATTVNVASATDLEIDMVLLAESEYMLITAIVANALTVERAYNGSTAAEHVQNTALSYYKASDVIRRQIVRIVQWSIEQAKSPMFGTVQVADVSIPVNIESMPSDVVKVARQLRWVGQVVAS
jgi:hypothetical protein